MKRKRDCAPAGQTARARGNTGTTGEAKHTGGRPPNQGIRTQRNSKQRAPRWPEPAGLAALDRLTALWGPPRYPFQRRPR